MPHTVPKLVTYGDAGRLFISSVGISVALYWGCGDYNTNQYIVDCQDSAAWLLYGCNYFLADHNIQDFANLCYVKPGTVGYIEYANGTRDYIVCDSIGMGWNSGDNLYDEYGNIDTINWGYALTTYTCTTDWQNVFMAHWRWR